MIENGSFNADVSSTADGRYVGDLKCLATHTSKNEYLVKKQLKCSSQTTS